MTHELFAYTVHDTKADSWLEPFYASNDAVAIRRVMVTCRDLDNPVSMHAEDYNLYCVGSYDKSTGKLSGTDHVSIGNLGPIRDQALTVKVNTDASASE